MKNFKAAIFDLDGTLVDSLDDLADSVNSMLKSFNFPEHKVNDYKQMVGDGINMLIKRALPQNNAFSESFLKECLSKVDREYDHRWNVKTRPYDGIPDALNELERRGISLGILSNKPHKFVIEVVPHFFPNNNFKIILGAREGIPRKPDPAGAFEASKILQVSPDECIYVGDSNVDMQTGKAAGMYAIGVNWGFRHRKELIESGADVVIDNPQELVSFFGDKSIID